LARDVKRDFQNFPWTLPGKRGILSEKKYAGGTNMSDLERIEAAMEEKVRPALRSHGGDISIDHVEGKTVYVKLLGQCAGCPSADLTNETIVEAELKAALPDLVEKAVVVQTVSDELWEQAKKLLREHHL